MDKYKEIRPIVLGIVKKDNKILVSEGYDKVKNETFYRSIGGGIKFLENSKDALKREFREELNIDINVGEFLGISENIFTYWLDIDRFINKELKIYPEQVFQYLT